MQPLRWFRHAAEYAIGATLVLAHLALAGRLAALLEDAARHRRDDRLRD